MAQTVAVIRGTTTVAGNGTTRTTLFTLSSGIATRVLVVGITFGTSTGAVRAWRNVLTINSNGSGTYLPVIVGTSNNNECRFMALFPNSANAQNGAQGQWAGTVNGQVSMIPGGSLVADGFSGYSTSAADMKHHAGSDFQQSATNNAVQIVPAQFWMANGDSLTYQCWNNNEYTGNIAYQFITVTES
jgi:hypothetical protein